MPVLLSKLEKLTLNRLKAGKKLKEIAKERGVSEPTIYFQLRRIRQKYIEAVTFAKVVTEYMDSSRAVTLALKINDRELEEALRLLRA